MISASREIPLSLPPPLRFMKSVGSSVYETGWFGAIFTRPCVTLRNHQAAIPPLSAVRAVFITLHVPDTSATCVRHPQPENLIGDVRTANASFLLSVSFRPVPWL